MNSFTDSAATFIEDHLDAPARRRAWEEFATLGLPSTSDEVWRYAPLRELALEHCDVPRSPAPSGDSPRARDLASRAGQVIHLVDGFPVGLGENGPGVRVSVEQVSDSLAGESLLTRYVSDSFGLLNAALAPATVVIRVEANADVEHPIVVINESRALSSFPRTQIVVGRGASVTVVEYYEGGTNALVVPMSEYRLDDNSSLRLVTYQRLDA